MITVENVKVFGFLDALRGMRNPLNSWEKNDSTFKCDLNDGHIIEANIGPNDAKLCKTLTIGGSPHRKFLRQIFVTMDITAPAYWWAEMDTYKICSTRNSCSVQHKGASRDFLLEDFTIDDILDNDEDDIAFNAWYLEKYENILKVMNHLRELYNNTKDYTYFRLLRQIMPMGYNYKATWSGNYEILLNIYEWRSNHKLKEWHELCNTIKTLPGMNIFLSK